MTKFCFPTPTIEGVVNINPLKFIIDLTSIDKFKVSNLHLGDHLVGNNTLKLYL